jgi:hypothetical protein
VNGRGFKACLSVEGYVQQMDHDRRGKIYPVDVQYILFMCSINLCYGLHPLGYEMFFLIKPLFRLN